MRKDIKPFRGVFLVLFLFGLVSRAEEFGSSEWTERFLTLDSLLAPLIPHCAAPLEPPHTYIPRTIAREPIAPPPRLAIVQPKPQAKSNDMKSAKPPAQEPAQVCSNRRFRFSADDLEQMQNPGKDEIVGGNANGGDGSTYSSDFLEKATEAKKHGAEVFAYFEGPCGDTNGSDPTGEKARCRQQHNHFNRSNKQKIADDPFVRWKPFTFQQLRESGRHQIDHCEIDNLNNNVTVPLIPLLTEIKAMYDRGEVYCRLTLKNIPLGSAETTAKRKKEGRPAPANATLNDLIDAFPTPEAAKFISPFHIYETSRGNRRLEAPFTQAMQRLKGPGAVTVLSFDSGAYGSDITRPTIRSCTRGTTPQKPPPRMDKDTADEDVPTS